MARCGITFLLTLTALSATVRPDLRNEERVRWPKSTSRAISVFLPKAETTDSRCPWAIKLKRPAGPRAVWAPGVAASVGVVNAEPTRRRWRRCVLWRRSGSATGVDHSWLVSAAVGVVERGPSSFKPPPSSSTSSNLQINIQFYCNNFIHNFKFTRMCFHVQSIEIDISCFMGNDLVFLKTLSTWKNATLFMPTVGIEGVEDVHRALIGRVSGD
ncbi:hypothetical protein T4D_8891 [Trichinella pseudospiralis]|uniref:Uncharacterized protein n=1 Tax=Trichinella pseudospiralis TaxID=6337 RepID=A0A0V1FAZ1_TRIPS|nr:hypothetical protein T4D_8891 [Trichinella pseudospiralis]